MNLSTTILLWSTYFLSLYFTIFFLLVFLENRPSYRNIPQKLRQYPKVSVIVPAYNEEQHIIASLKSVLRLQYPKDKLQVIVVNDGSTDKTKDVVQQFIQNKPNILLLSQSNQGKAAALNHALSHVTGEYFACLDADSFVHPNTLIKMLALAEEDKNLAIITPAMKVLQPKNLLQKMQWIEYIVMMFITRLTSNLNCQYVAPGPFSLYQTHIIQKLGKFDPTSLTEDQEIAYRVQEKQYRLKMCPTGYVYTVAPQTWKGFIRQRKRWYKGSLGCVQKYRKLILNRSYGDFGYIQMMKNVLGYLLAIASLWFTIYFVVIPVYQKLYNLNLVGFDVSPYIANFEWNYTYLNLNIPFIAIFLCYFILGILFLYFSHKNANEKVLPVGLLPLIPYFFIYYLIKGSILLISLAEYVTRINHKW